MTPEQMKEVKLLDPVTTGHLLQDSPENAALYASSLIKSSGPEDFKENYWFPTPENHDVSQQHTPIQKRILEELLNLQELEKLKPRDNPESKNKFLTNFVWTDSMLQPNEIERIEELVVEFHDKFARHRFDIGMNEEFKIKLTPKDDSPANSQSLPTPINLKEDILVTFTLLWDINNTPILQIFKPNFCPEKW